MECGSKIHTACQREIFIGDDVFVMKHVVSLAAKSNFLCLHQLHDGLDNLLRQINPNVGTKNLSSISSIKLSTQYFN